ncbi:hypothetical protein [Actinomycetospora sp. NBRC 106378]|uniref:hypothetical protein n=1 Tax=Actinomycetospora sp. NBRC 106378 TaxID=3032208 RepID=UPI0024A20791|nr:hypothetical protein [Actinomycetospora sp. NBRC 106378]GLZ53018.1 hypothetical protein Acsp07_26350 [Actinomycetospora sp. NBRC 106378]
MGSAGSGLADPEFVRLGEALQRRHRVQGRMRRTAATVACAVPALRERMPVLADLPQLLVTSSVSEAGDRMAAKYDGTRSGVPRRLAVSVLSLPDSVEDYLRGRSKQALRTNSRRAREAGVTCRRMGRVEAEVRISALLRAREEEDLLPGVRADLVGGLVQAWVARDADDVTEVIALTSADGPFARLDLMLSAPDREAGPARYLLSAHLVGELIERGVRHLAVDTALWLDSGLRHFQRLLGFEPTTLEFTRGSAVDVLPDDGPFPAPRVSSGPLPVAVPTPVGSAS